jgi:hypothetical protein
MPDVFGYENNVKNSGSIASAQFAHITTGDRQALVQQVTVNYGQQIDTVTVVGDPNIYWVPGKPSGTLDVTKLVGADGFFQGWKGNTCGKINNLAVSVDGTHCGFTGSGNMTFSGGIIARLSVTLGSGALTIAETCSIQIASLSAN